MQFTQVPTLVIRELKALALEPREVILLLYILSFAFMADDGGVVAVSLREMSRLTGLSSATIHAAKNGLIAKGFIALVDARNQDRVDMFDLSPLEARLDSFTKEPSKVKVCSQETDTADVRNSEQKENHEPDPGQLPDQGQPMA